MCFSVLQNERGLSRALPDRQRRHDLPDDRSRADGLSRVGVEHRVDRRRDVQPRRREARAELLRQRPVRPEARRQAVQDQRPHDPRVRLHRRSSTTRSLRLVARAHAPAAEPAAEFPQISPGVQSWDTLPQADVVRVRAATSATTTCGIRSGIRGRSTSRRSAASCAARSASRCSPRGEPPKAERRRVVPDAADELQATTPTTLYKANEQRADGGFFPVGPWGEARLWHGGVHLAAKRRRPVFAPFPGRLVAARMGTTVADRLGQLRAAAPRHGARRGARRSSTRCTCTSPTSCADKPVEWMTKRRLEGGASRRGRPARRADRGRRADRRTSARPARPSSRKRADPRRVLRRRASCSPACPASPWTVVDGTAGGRFCDAPADQRRDRHRPRRHAVASHELVEFYARRRRRSSCTTWSRCTSPSGRPSRAGPTRCACRRTSRR